MKLESNNIITHNDGSGHEEKFSIGNIGMVINILRSKLYSRPIEAIMREYSCNAMDANIENGLADKPIKVTLPTSLDSSLRIRDFGIGISDERMFDIFIKYGNSTKRDSNEFIGAFGLGAKTAFSYSDQFSIVTIVKEGDKNLKNTYIAYIDESECGKMRKVSSEETEEDTGTEIIIEVAQKDFRTFSEAYSDVFRYWKVKPQCNCNFNFELKNYYEDENIIILDEPTSYLYNNRINVLIGDIFYKGCSISELNLPKDYSYFNCILKLNIGDISVSASREDIYLDNKTKQAIVTKLQNSIDLIKNNASEDIAKAKDIFEAKYLHDSKYIFLDIEYNGFKLQAFNKNGLLNYSFADGYSEGTKYLCSDKINIVISDTKTKNDDRIALVRNDYSKFFVYKKYNEYGDATYADKKEAFLQDLNKNYPSIVVEAFLSKTINFIYLSDYKIKNIKNKKPQIKNEDTIKVSVLNNEYPHNHYSEIKNKSFLQKEIPYIYYISEKEKYYYSKDGDVIDYEIRRLQDLFRGSLYVLNSRNINKFPNAKPVKEYLNDSLKEILEDTGLNIQDLAYNLLFYKNDVSRFFDKNSKILSYINRSDYILQVIKFLHPGINENLNDFHLLNKYPMLKLITGTYVNNSTDIKQYIHLVDSQESLCIE